MKMRILFVGVLAFLLSGCFGEKSGSFFETTFTDRFQIGETIWQLSLPSGWGKVTPPEGSEAIFLTRKGTDNFSILRRQGMSENLSQKIWDQAPHDFFFFEPISFTENAWEFQARTSASLPIREFWQKIFPIPGTDFFLLGSCSFEIKTSDSSDCETILNSWQISVDKKTQAK